MHRLTCLIAQSSCCNWSPCLWHTSAGTHIYNSPSIYRKILTSYRFTCSYRRFWMKCRIKISKFISPHYLRSNVSTKMEKDQQCLLLVWVDMSGMLHMPFPCNSRIDYCRNSPPNSTKRRVCLPRTTRGFPNVIHAIDRTFYLCLQVVCVFCFICLMRILDVQSFLNLR